MEIIDFYLSNIVAGSLLVVLLGGLGSHAIARNQSLDVMLLGQEFQTSILISAVFLNYFIFDGHDEHGFHLETLISLLLVCIIHFCFAKVLRNKNQYKVEAAIVGIVLLMGVSQLVVALAPSIEFHMVKSFVGDIVTVSRYESVTVATLTVICLIVLNLKNKAIFKDSLEIALFNKIIFKRYSYYAYNILLLVSMLFSIHLFGSLFTIGAILIPSFVCTFLRLNIREIQLLNWINWISVPLAFWILNLNDRIPTTVMIVGLITLSSTIFCLIRKSFSLSQS